MSIEPAREAADTMVGTLGGTRIARVDRAGTVHPERVLWDVEWWVGADDRWHLPVREAAVRQSLVDDMPVVRTAMRVPGGDAVQHVYGAAGDTVVVDLENASPAPFVGAFVVRGAGQIALHDTTVVVDGVPTLSALRPPSRWAAAVDGTLDDRVTSGNAVDGAMPPMRDRAARIEAAFLYPVAHRTRLRVALALARPGAAGASGAGDLMAFPQPEDVARGWRAQLGRGMRVELPDPVLQRAVDAARAQLLLAGHAWRSDPAVVAALEDWGFDEEALAAWNRLGILARRRASRRPSDGPGWDALSGSASPSGGESPAPAPFLLALRRLLVHERAEGITVLRDWPSEWTGLPLDVRDAPSRSGPVSFSVRWHGERPVLIWDVPEGLRVRAPGLDATWSSNDARGETLLAPAG